MTITEFLLARIAEDEAAVPYRPAPTVGDDVLAQIDEAQHGYRALKPGVLTVTTARVLAECEAKRRIVEGHAETWDLGREDYLEGVWRSEDHTIRVLASVYADHPDFQDEWRMVG